jgi:hypothetical protein
MWVFLSNLADVFDVLIDVGLGIDIGDNGLAIGKQIGDALRRARFQSASLLDSGNVQHQA